jgi:hypothetical protein
MKLEKHVYVEVPSEELPGAYVLRFGDLCATVATEVLEVPNTPVRTVRE